MIDFQNSLDISPLLELNANLLKHINKPNTPTIVWLGRNQHK